MPSQVPARGNTVQFSAAPHLEGYFPPSSGWEYYKVNLPGGQELERTEEADGSVNPSGFVQEYMPSTVRGGTPELNLRLTTGHMIPWLYHLLRGYTKNAISGGFEYILEGDQAGDDFGFATEFVLAPVENYIRHGFKVNSFELPLGTTTVLIAKLSGQIVHGQSYDLATADVGNTGSYAGPVIRGPVKFRDLGSVYVQVASLAPLTFIAELTDIAPTFPGSALTAYIDGITSRGDWMNLQGAVKQPGTVSVTAGTAAVTGVGTQFLKYFGSGTASAGKIVDIAGEEIAIASVASDTALTLAANHVAGAAGVVFHLLGQDFGFYGENKDPVEIAWPGTDTDHSDADVGDEWLFAYPIVAPTPSYTVYNRFNKSHVLISFREVGETTWIPFPSIAATLKIEWPTEGEESTGSRYLVGLDRIGSLMATLDPFDTVYRERNTAFVNWAEAHEDLEAKVEILGNLMGDGSHREGFEFFFPNGSITKANRPISGEGRLNLNAASMFTTNAAGDSPVTVTIWSPRDYTPPVIV